MTTEERIEGFCYCLCGHTAGKHTTPDPNDTKSKCREPGCICKRYEHGEVHAKKAAVPS